MPPFRFTNARKRQTVPKSSQLVSFTGYAVSVPVEMGAVASLSPIYRCRTCGSGCRTIGIIIPGTCRTHRLWRNGSPAVTVPAAIFSIIMATVGGSPSAMCLNSNRRDCAKHQRRDKETERDHSPTIGRKCQIAMKLIFEEKLKRRDLHFTPVRHEDGLRKKWTAAGFPRCQ